MHRSTSVVIPVRSFEGAKLRLGAALDAEERASLVERLLRRLVAVARAVDGVAEVIVVSADPEVLAVATETGARPLPQRTQGLNPALAEARDAAIGDRLLVLPGDLPAAAPADVAAVLAAGDAAGSPCVVLVPDRYGLGTNALLLDPPTAIDPAFGGDSRAGHAWLATSADVRYVELSGLPGLDLDLDTPDDLLLAGAVAPEAIHAS